MAVTKNANARFHFYQPFFGWTEVKASRQKEAGESLHVPAAQKPARTELPIQLE